MFSTPLVILLFVPQYSFPVLSFLMFPFPDATSQLALNALLDRSQEVLVKFVEDERLSGSCPLPRSVPIPFLCLIPIHICAIVEAVFHTNYGLSKAQLHQNV